MNIKNHFESYRASLKRDVLDGYVEVANTTPTKLPDIYPHISDYLRKATSMTKEAITKGCVDTYRKWLLGHQKCMLKLFSKMVEDEEHDNLFALIQRRGWKWFKFSNSIIELDKAYWIPRYGEEFVEYWYSDKKPCYDADELSIIVARNKDKSFFEKKSKACKRLDPAKDPTYLCNINNIIVRDWAVKILI